MMIILLILITLSLDSVWILLGENCCWSLLGLKRVKTATPAENHDYHQLCHEIHQNCKRGNCHQTA